MFHAASSPAETRPRRLRAARRLGVEVRLDLVARGLGASSCQMYHETWYTPETASELGKHLYCEALSRIGCTTWDRRRGTTFRLVNQCFPPMYHEYHVFLTVYIGDAFGSGPGGSSPSSPVCSLIPPARVSSLYFLVQVVRGVCKPRLTWANTCTT